MHKGLQRTQHSNGKVLGSILVTVNSKLLKVGALYFGNWCQKDIKKTFGSAGWSVWSVWRG